MFLGYKLVGQFLYSPKNVLLYSQARSLFPFSGFLAILYIGL